MSSRSQNLADCHLTINKLTDENYELRETVDRLREIIERLKANAISGSNNDR